MLSSAHVVIDVDLELYSRAVGDDSSLLHVIAPRQSIVGNRLEVKTIIYPGASLKLPDGATVTIEAPTKVLGAVESGKTNNLILNSTLFVDQELSLLSLTLLDHGNISTTPGAVLVLNVSSVVVNGTLNVTHVDFTDLSDLTVHEHGTVEYTPVSDLVCDELVINGVVAIRSNVTIRGRLKHNLNFLNIGENGTLQLDSLAQANRSWTGRSVLGCHSLDVAGTLLAGRVEQYTDTFSWEYIRVDAKGNFTFEPTARFHVTNVDVLGHMQAYSPLNLADNTTAGQTLIVADVLTIYEEGVLDIDFKCGKRAPDRPCPVSNLTINIIRLNGTIQAGSLTINASDLNISPSGLIDLSEGGYPSGTGPGQYSNI